MYVHNHIVLALSRRRSGYETTNAMEDSQTYTIIMSRDVSGIKSKTSWRTNLIGHFIPRTFVL